MLPNKLIKAEEINKWFDISFKQFIQGIQIATGHRDFHFKY